MSFNREIMVCALAMVLSGCGKSYDGTYLSSSNPFTASVLEISGESATLQHVNTVQQKVTSRVDFDVDQRSDKITFTGKNDGRTFVYARAVDERGIECISDSCKGAGSIRVWYKQN